MLRMYAFTERVRRALVAAPEASNRLGAEYVGVEHLLLGALDLGDDQLERIFVSLGSSSQTVREALLSRLHAGTPLSSSTELPYTSRAKKVLEGAMDEAERSRHDAVDLEHLLLAMAGLPGIAIQALMDAHIDREQFRATIHKAWS